MTEYRSLDYFKKEHKISDSSGGNISIIFKVLFEEYLYNEQSIKEPLLDDLLEECKEVNQSLIPYSEITNIIFATYFHNGTENHFPEKLKSEFEKKIVKKFSRQPANEKEMKTPKNNEDLFALTSKYDSVSLSISGEYENAILVFYKLIQHVELAISQKQSLYEDLKEDINYLTDTVDSATGKYDNMMSNFISILGIFAAIMMATFGAIQGFTAIYTNESNYNLTTIILISSFGLFALLSVLYLLLYSISRLVDKELSPDSYSPNIFVKYPIYSHALVAIFIMFFFALTHMFKVSPPSYFPNHLVDNIWGYFILFSLLIVLVYCSHLLVLESDGYNHINRHISNYIMKVKRRLGLEKLLNWIISIVITIFMIVIAFVIYNIVN